MSTLFMKMAVLVMALFIANIANAGIIAFNDRVAFESYVGSGILVDDLNGNPSIAPFGQQSFVRNDYTVSGSMWGCVDGSGCTDPYALMEDDYIWTYVDVSFDFDSGISAFGLDFDSYNSKMDGTEYVASLNGSTAIPTLVGGFFGIASDDGSLFNSVIYGKNTRYGLFDNVTYSRTITGVSEPSIIALFMAGLFGLGFARRRRTG